MRTFSQDSQHLQGSINDAFFDNGALGGDTFGYLGQRFQRGERLWTDAVNWLGLVLEQDDSSLNLAERMIKLPMAAIGASVVAPFVDNVSVGELFNEFYRKKATISKEEARAFYGYDSEYEVPRAFLKKRKQYLDEAEQLDSLMARTDTNWLEMTVGLPFELLGGVANPIGAGEMAINVASVGTFSAAARASSLFSKMSHAPGRLLGKALDTQIKNRFLRSGIEAVISNSVTAAPQYAYYSTVEKNAGLHAFFVDNAFAFGIGVGLQGVLGRSAPHQMTKGERGSIVEKVLDAETRGYMPPSSHAAFNALADKYGSPDAHELYQVATEYVQRREQSFWEYADDLFYENDPMRGYVNDERLAQEQFFDDARGGLDTYYDDFAISDMDVDDMQLEDIIKRTAEGDAVARSKNDASQFSDLTEDDVDDMAKRLGAE